MRFKTTCNVCRDTFEFNPLKKGGRFCSPDCRINKPNVNEEEEIIDEECSICGDSFKYSNFENGVFCSPNCVKRASDKIEKSETDNCEECGSKFLYNSSRRDRKFCSNTCYKISQGSDGDGRISRKYMSYKDDYNRCEVCSKKTDELEVHHILPVRYNNKYINIEDNLIALCSRCHTSVDSHRRGPDVGDKEKDWRMTLFRDVTKDKRAKMIERLVEDNQSRKLIKVLFYNNQV